jgi:hypothetical protein
MVTLAIRMVARHSAQHLFDIAHRSLMFIDPIKEIYVNRCGAPATSWEAGVRDRADREVTMQRTAVERTGSRTPGLAAHGPHS